MPDTCSAVGCKNRRQKKRRTDDGPELHFYRIPWGHTPQKTEKRRLWMQAICRAKLPLHARICSAHFISGAASDDPKDPDYVPSLFSYNGHHRQLSQAHMDKCCIPNCCNDSRYNQTRTRSLSFHPFPKSPELSNQWINKIVRTFGKDLQVTKNTRICSRHFRKSDLISDERRVKVVKPRVLPSKFQLMEKDSSDVSLPEGKVQERTGPSVRKQELSEEEQSDEMPTRSSTCDLRSSVDEPQVVQTRLHLANDRINALESQCKILHSKLFSLDRFSSDSDCIEYYTGFTNYETLMAIYLALEPLSKSNSLRWTEVQRYCKLAMGSSEDPRVSLPLIDQFFLFLCYVKQGFCEQDLAVRFNQPVKSITYILLVWINYLFVSLRKFQIWPSRKAVDATMPACFQTTYPNTRVILDCTEVTVQMPGAEIPGHQSSDVVLNFKGLLGISPNGTVTFVSDLYNGCMSNCHIVKSSRILNLISDPCTVMAHASFQVPDAYMYKSPIIVPPFWALDEKTTQPTQMSELKRNIERALAHVKDYRVFQTIIPRSLAESANEMWMVCALLANFKTSQGPDTGFGYLCTI